MVPCTLFADTGKAGAPLKEKTLLYLKIVVNLILCILTAVLVIWLGPKLISFFLPFVIAIIVSAIANPLVNFLEKKVKILRKHSSAVIIVLVLAVLFAVIYLLIWSILQGLQSLFGELDNIIATFLGFLDDFRLALTNLSISLPDSLHETISSLDASIETALTGFATDLMEQINLSAAGSYLNSALNILILIIISILATYFVMIDRNQLALIISRAVPTSIQQYYHVVMDNIKTAVGGYLKTQLKLMLIIMLALFVGFKLLDVEYALLLAFITSILDFLPVFGTGTIIGPWVVFELISGDYLYAVFLIIIYLVCLLLKQLLQPKIMGDSVGLSPLYALFFMFVGYRINGIIGMIIGIPVGMILLSFYRAGFFNRILKGFKIIIHDINEFRKY